MKLGIERYKYVYMTERKNVILIGEYYWFNYSLYGLAVVIVKDV